MAKKLQIGDAVSTVSTIKIDDQEAGGGLEVIDFGKLTASSQSVYTSQVSEDNTAKMLAAAAAGQPFVAKYTLDLGVLTNSVIYSVVNILYISGTYGFHTASINLGQGMSITLMIGQDSPTDPYTITVSLA